MANDTNTMTRTRILKNLAKAALIRVFGIKAGNALSQLIGGWLSAVVVLLVMFSFQVFKYVVPSPSSNQRFTKRIASLMRRSNLEIVVNGDPAHLYPSNSPVELTVDVIDRDDRDKTLEAADNELGLLSTTDGRDAGFTRTKKFPIVFQRDGLPPSEYSVLAEFFGNDQANKAKSIPYEFRVFEQDFFDPHASPAKWVQFSSDGIRQTLHKPFAIKVDPASHRGEFMLTIAPSGVGVPNTPLIWYQPTVPFPCEVILGLSALGTDSGFVVAFDDVFWIILGNDPSYSDKRIVTSEDSANPRLIVFQNDREQGTFSSIKAIDLPSKLLLRPHRYRIRIEHVGKSKEYNSYKLQFDVLGELPQPFDVEFQSTLQPRSKSQIGLGWISNLASVDVRSFEVFGVKQKSFATSSSGGQ
jgi:hypothetical protein